MIPKFRTLHEEKRFWQTHDSANFIDWSRAKRVLLPHLKPSTRSISLRLPEDLLSEIKVVANKEDIPYQSLMKLLLAQGIHALRG